MKKITELLETFLGHIIRFYLGIRNFYQLNHDEEKAQQGYEKTLKKQKRFLLVQMKKQFLH